MRIYYRTIAATTRFGFRLERFKPFKKFKSFKPSIAELFVDNVKEGLSGNETLKIVDEDRQKRRPLFFGEAADAWTNDNIRQAPEFRIFRQGLARERVQRRAGDPVFFQSSDQK